MCEKTLNNLKDEIKENVGIKFIIRDLNSDSIQDPLWISGWTRIRIQIVKCWIRLKRIRIRIYILFF